MGKEIQIKSVNRVRAHGEVLTASKEIEAMLDLVKSESECIESLFFEPACGDGNFLVAILKRKLKTVVSLYKNKKNDFEINLICALSSIYGVDLLADNVQIAIDRMFEIACTCYKNVLKTQPNEELKNIIRFILQKNILQGDSLNGTENIIFTKWNFQSTEKYTFDCFQEIHYQLKDMCFDVIIGNPPYQISDGGGTGDSAKPIYQLFIQLAKILNPCYFTMIVPSRWMKGGKGLYRFRQEMIADTRIKIIHDFEDAKMCFPDVHIDGGVCYFLWDRDYKGKVEYHFYSLDGSSNVSKRPLKSDFTDTVIRDFRQISIIEKSCKFNEHRFSDIVTSRNPYGFYADLFNTPQKYPAINIYEKDNGGLYKIYGVKGKKGGAKRITGYIKKECIKKNLNGADSFKLFFSKAYTQTSTVPPRIIVGNPQTVCTETFLQIGNFTNQKETLNCLKYIKTKFFRALLFFNRHSLNASKKSFDLIPCQDFKEEWTDIKLYKKYGLTQEEIDFIESIIKPMY